MRRGAATVFLTFVALRLTAEPVRCASAGSMDALLAAWARDYNAGHPAAPVRITTHAAFAAGAFDALLRGEVQLAPFSRELFPSETRRYQERFGRVPRLVPVAVGSRDTKGGTHAIAIFVNAKNPLTRLTLPDLKEILADGGALTTWGQLGLGGAWAKRRIAVHGMVTRRASGDPPGIVNFLAQRVLAGRRWRTDIQVHADVPDGPQALDLIVRAVAADETAIGYSGFGYAQPGTRTLALAETAEGPFFSGTIADIEHADYPLTRRVYLCLAGAPPESVCAFVAFILSPAGQGSITESPERFFPLPARERDTAARFAVPTSHD